MTAILLAAGAKGYELYVMSIRYVLLQNRRASMLILADPGLGVEPGKVQYVPGVLELTARNVFLSEIGSEQY